MIPKKAINEKKNRDKNDQVRRFSGMTNETRSKYAKAINNENWEDAHKILCKVVFGFDYEYGDY